jgi:hypothetical protein
VHPYRASAEQLRWPALVVVALLVASSCQSVTPTPSANPLAQTQWQKVLTGIGPKGEVEPAMAAAAFSLAVAQLPGVDLPVGSPPTTAEIIDGAAPVRWLLRVWDRLTPDQQAAATAALDSLGAPDFSALQLSKSAQGPGSVLAAATPGATAEPQCGIWLNSVTEPPIGLPAAVQPYAEDLQKASAAFSGHLQRDPVSKWGVCLTTATTANAATVTRVLDSDGTDKGEADRCVINLNSGYFAGLKATDQGRYGYALSVAAFRCFLATAAYYGPAVRAPYVEEGLTAWAAGTVSQEVFGGPGGALGNVWPGYLLEPGEFLFNRSWDAVGFYSQLDEIEVVWDVVDPMLRAADAEAAWYRSGGRTAAFWGVWAAGFFRDPGRGSEWDIAGPGVTSDVPAPAPLSVANGTSKTLETGPLTAAIFEVTATADITYVGGTDVRFSDGAIDQQIHNHAYPYCTKEDGRGDCTCPPDSLRGRSGLPTPTSLGSSFHFALTGAYDPAWGVSGGKASLQGLSLDDFCVKESTPTPKPTPHPTAKPKGGPNPCADGCAGSVGDPHLETIDLQEYDFQGAGEYELLRNADGSMDIQARQVPYPDIADVSINTALAWKVNGHRVGIYAEGGAYVLRLDGAEVDPSTAGTIDLGGGAALTPLGVGVEVAFPDGTISTAVFHGNEFADALDIQVAPSTAFKAQSVGLLGPIASGSELPAMPDGSGLPLSADRATRYAQRYAQLGPAWHVTDLTSLFDYATGESSSTFDVPGFPSSDVAFDVEELQARQGLAQFQAAAETCAPVQADQREFLHCVFDVLATKNPAYAEFYKMLEQFLIEGPTAIDAGPSPSPEPTATPTTNLPAGFFSVEPAASLLRGAGIGPDEKVYLSVQKADQTFELLEMDPASGAILKNVPLTGGGVVAQTAGSLWVGVDDPSGSNKCSIVRYEPGTLVVQQTFPVGCDFLGPMFAVTDATVWWLDRSTADADGHGGLLRPIDPATGVTGPGVELPSINGYVVSSRTTVFYGSDLHDLNTYRLGAGDSTFASMGEIPLGFPADGGLWTKTTANGQGQSEWGFYTGPGGPQQRLTIEGSSVGADESALYASRTGAGGDQLWRNPTDGSAPSQIATSTTIQISGGIPQVLYYGANGGQVFVGDGWAIGAWLVAGFATPNTSALVVQAAPIP